MSMNLGDFLEQELKAAGVDLKKSGADVAAYARSLVPELVIASSEPGYDKAVRRAAKSVLLYASEKDVDAADTADARAFHFVLGVLGTIAVA
jgi:hypothetical protein